MLIDTHCHIYWKDYPIEADDVIKRANLAGVKKMICVGTNQQDSLLAVDFSANRSGIFSSIGIHPYYATELVDSFDKVISEFEQLLTPAVVRNRKSPA